jgi:hypothetical protein
MMQNSIIQEHAYLTKLSKQYTNKAASIYLWLLQQAVNQVQIVLVAGAAAQTHSGAR